MELNKREKAYLSLYKGDENAIDVLLPNVDEELRLLYAVDYNYKQVNTFINFILTKNPNLLNDVSIMDIDGVMDMIFTLSDVACRYALIHPLMAYHLYRMENKNNIEDYNNGMTMSFKSCSESFSETSVFRDNDSVGITIDTVGYIPYIDVDNIIDSRHFSDEKEVIFPPCIKTINTGAVEKKYNGDYINMVLEDDFSELLGVEDISSYAEAKNNFKSELDKCKKENRVSETLTSYCMTIGLYMYAHLRNMYNKYAKMDKDFNNDFKR